MNSTCEENFYKSEDQYFTQIIVPILLVSVGLVLLSIVAIGALAAIIHKTDNERSKSAYKTMALMSIRVLTKLALIPDLEDECKGDFVFFKTSGKGGEERRYKFKIGFAAVFIPLGVSLVLAYASVFVTSQWESTTECEETNTFNLPKTCYRDFQGCPPVNCTLWNKLGRTDNLLCYSLSFDIFTPLANFVGLIGSQVVLIEFFFWFANEGCPMEPFCRYFFVICGNIVVLAILIILVIIFGTIPGTDPVQVFVSFVIPFVHLILVTLLETVFLAAFVTTMWMTRPEPPPGRRVTVKTTVTKVACSGHDLKPEVTLRKFKDLRLESENGVQSTNIKLGSYELQLNSSGTLELMVNATEIVTFELPTPIKGEIVIEDGEERPTLKGELQTLSITNGEYVKFKTTSGELELTMEGEKIGISTKGKHDINQEWDFSPSNLGLPPSRGCDFCL